jgi:predicted porin
MSIRRSAAAATLALACSPAAFAQSSVNLYGVLDVFAGRITNSLPDSSTTVVGGGGLQTSFFGVRGSEDLGGGLRAVFAIESFMQVDTGASARFPNDLFWSRSAWVGLAGSSWGQLTLGRNTTPYFLATILFNPLVDSFVVGPMITHTFRGNLQGDTGMGNSLRWTSPNWGGFRADLLYSMGEERTGPPDKDFGKAIDGALGWSGGPAAVVLAFRNIDLSANGNGREQTAWQLGATWQLAFAKLFAQYQRVSEEFAARAANVDRDTVQLGVSAPIGPGTLLASYATMDIDDALPATPAKRDTWALAYTWSLSKRSELYGAYYQDALKEPAANKQTVLALGIRHRF